MDFVSLLFNAFNISVFLGVVALSFVAAFVTFQVKSLAAYALDSLAAMIAFVSAMFLYLPYLSQAVMSYYYINFVPAALFVALTLLHLRRSRHAEIFVFLWLIASSMVFSAFVYPYLFGGTVNVNAALPQASSAFYVLLISIFGAVFLAIAIGVLLYARSRAGRGPPRGRH